MICLFRNCIKKATCSVNYYYYIGYVLCDHHKELLSILCEYYHNSSYEEEIKLRRMCLFLYNTNFSDYGHCERAKIRVCIYCHVIDYIDFIVGPQVNDDGVCESCVQKRKILEEQYKDNINGWDANGYITYQNKKWKYINF